MQAAKCSGGTPKGVHREVPVWSADQECSGGPISRWIHRGLHQPSQAVQTKECRDVVRMV
ncbi:unnamed protein product [Brassica oleracea]